MSRVGIEILAKSIYRELCDRGCLDNDVIRLATALLEQIISHKIRVSWLVESMATQIERI